MITHLIVDLDALLEAQIKSLCLGGNSSNKTTHLSYSSIIDNLKHEGHQGHVLCTSAAKPFLFFSLSLSTCSDFRNHKSWRGKEAHSVLNTILKGIVYFRLTEVECN